MRTLCRVSDLAEALEAPIEPDDMQKIKERGPVKFPEVMFYFFPDWRLDNYEK